MYTLLRLSIILAALSFSLLSQAEENNENTLTEGLADKSFAELMNVKMASKFKYTLAQSPGAITVYDQDDLKRLGVKRLIDVLNFIPGLQSVAPQNSLDSTVFSRGESKALNSNVLLIIDGVRVNDYLFNSWMFTYNNYPLEHIEKIEILQSSGSNMYGAYGVGSTIQVITQKDKNKARVGMSSHQGHEQMAQYASELGPVHLNFMLGQSKDEGEEYNKLQTFDQPWDIQDSAQDEIIDSVRDPNKRIDSQLDINIGSFDAGIAYAYQRNQDYYGFDDVVVDGFLRSEIMQTRWYLSYAKEFDSNINVQGQYSANYNKFKYRAPLITDNSQPFGFFSFGPAGYVSIDPRIANKFPQGLPANIYSKERHSSVYHNLDLNLGWMPKDRFNILAGVEIQYGKLLTDSIESNFDLQTLEYLSSPKDLPYDRFGANTESTLDIAVYSELKYTISPRLELNLSARYDQLDTTDNNFSPRLGLNYYVTPKHTLKAIYSQSNHPENRSKVFGYSQNTAQQDNLIEHEYFELIHLYHHDGNQFQTVLYQRDISQIHDNFSAGQIRVFDIKDKLTTVGLESGFKVALNSFFDLNGSFNYLIKHQQNDSRQLVFEPSKLNASLAIGAHYENFSANLSATYQRGVDERRTSIQRAEADYPSQSYFNFNAKYQFTKQLSVDVSAQNIFDREYALYEKPFPRTEGDWYPLRGRVLGAGVNYEF